MPAGYTHYTFSQDIINNLTNNHIKKVILDNLDLFNIGIHGPDIFFYHKPYIRNDKVNKLGRRMHKDIAYAFFDDSRKAIDNDARLAYILGFICHFGLDSNLHGYVQTIIDETNVQHFEIEGEYDRILMERNHLNPLIHPLTKHIKINDLTVSNIQPFFKLSTIEIENSLKSMKRFDHILLSRNIFKRGLIYAVMHLTFNFKKLQGLVINYKPNKKLIPYIKKLDDLYSLSIDETIALLEDYYNKYQTNEELSSRFKRNYK